MRRRVEELAEKMGNRVRHNIDHSRYDLFVDGELAGIADYHLGDDGTVVFPHTEIVPALRERGLGAELVRAALDDVRARGGTVRATCWYVARFIDEHPEYADLLAAHPGTSGPAGGTGRPGAPG